tara:strand:- start:60 stop:1343 length:1284 start_codon:yes stop_codon:yes gene_type:complete
MGIGFKFSNYDWSQKKDHLTDEVIQKYLNTFLETINSPKHGFFEINKDLKLLEKVNETYQKFKHKKFLIHVGIGGSSLGTETLVNSIGKPSLKDRIFFINNIDPDEIKEILDKIDLKESLFYIVSKSGGTAETIASFCLILNHFKENGFSEKDFYQSTVIATDPDKGQLRSLSNSYKIETLPIQENIGGRFCVFTPVGLFPSLFAGVDVKKVLEGAEKIKEKLSEKDIQKNILIRVASFLTFLKIKKNINQTVLMPYSSKLKILSLWFVQLWAESLGKKDSLDGKEIYEGLTPIGAYGATDQHSQMQLFMDGPKDKCIIFIEISNFKNDFKLKNNEEGSTFSKLKKSTLKDLLKAELEGTLKAFDEKGRPYFLITIDELNEENMGALLIFFQSLTVLMGSFLHINPFDQPGVELAKKYSIDFLKGND